MNTQTYLLKIVINLLLPIILFDVLEVNAQSFKEQIEFHSNGQTKIEIIKDINLNIIRKNEYDINGSLIEYMNFDPITRIKNGDFLQGSNKGYYTQGEINCSRCAIAMKEGNYGSSIVLEGEFVRGKPKGLIDVYSVRERQTLQKDSYTSYLLSLEHGKRVNYSSYVGTGMYDKTKLMTLTYDDNGYLNGEQVISEYTMLNYKNGILTGVFTLNELNTAVYKDSISRDSNVWKINNRYYKNIGWLKSLRWHQYEGNTKVFIEYPENTFEYRVFFGNQNTKYASQLPMIGIEYGGFGELLENGIYARVENKDDLPTHRFYNDVYNFSNFFFSVPLEIEELDLKLSDIRLFDFFNSEDVEFLNNNAGRYYVKQLQELSRKKSVNTSKFYEVMQNVIDDSGTPFLEVYLGTNPGKEYKTFRNVHKEILIKVTKMREEKKKREQDSLIVLERINKEIKNADLKFVISNHLSFLGGEKEVVEFANRSAFQKWSSEKDISASMIILSKPNGYLEYTVVYQNLKQIILIDGDSKKGFIYSNYDKRRKLDKTAIKNLEESSYVIPDVYYLQTATYEGVEEFFNENNTKERAYKIRTEANELIYYSVVDFRKIVKIASNQTAYFYSLWKNIDGVKFAHENKIVTNGKVTKYILTEFKFDPTISEDYFSRKIKF